MNLVVRVLVPSLVPFLVAFAPSLARAEDIPPAEYPAARCAGLFAEEAERCAALSRPEPLDAHARTHDGLFMRAGFGAAALHARNGDVLGAGAEVLAGGTPLPGFVVGGGVIGEALGRARPLIAYAAFAQLYPDPKNGLHFQVLAALALLEDKPSILGPLGAAGVGFDVFAGAELSLGAFARAGYARGFGEGGLRVDAPFASVAATLTWH